jgi:hypothetical protein
VIPKPKDTGKELRKVKAALVAAFSRFIRLRDTDENGEGKCFTCGQWVRFDEAQAGHFVRCAKEATRFDEQNVHLQCVECNTAWAGQIEAYRAALDERYGAGTADRLIEKGEGFQFWALPDLRAALRHYRAQVRVLLQEKRHD